MLDKCLVPQSHHAAFCKPFRVVGIINVMYEVVITGGHETAVRGHLKDTQKYKEHKHAQL